MKRKRLSRTFICSPLSGPNFAKNIEFAKIACKYRLIEFGEATFAPHAFYTAFLDDDNPKDREIGIDAGLAFLRVCSLLVYYPPASGPTSGMTKEIELAREIGIDVVECIGVYDSFMQGI